MEDVARRVEVAGVGAAPALHVVEEDGARTAGVQVVVLDIPSCVPGVPFLEVAAPCFEVVVLGAVVPLIQEVVPLTVADVP